MKTAFRITANIINWILILLILLFALALFLGKSYVQTFTLLLIATSLVWWPGYFKKKWNNTISIGAKIGFILSLVLINILFLKPKTKTSIYLSESHKNELMQIYDKNLNDWPTDTEDIFIDTKYGKVHVLACGSDENPPLIMIHAASMGAHSWQENLEPLLNHYRIYSFDNIGEGNKSELNNALFFPENGRELANLYADLVNKLGIKSCPVLGASNGGFIAQCYTYYYPDKVEKLALLGPMGLTQLSSQSILMLSLASMYPLPAIREFTAKWALGNNKYVHDKYGDWFTCIMKSTIPSLAMPVPMTTEQKQQMKLPILLFLGTKDAIVGDAEQANQIAKEYPNIQIEILESGHLIAVEHSGYVNNKISEFLNIH